MCLCPLACLLQTTTSGYHYLQFAAAVHTAISSASDQCAVPACQWHCSRCTYSHTTILYNSPAAYTADIKAAATMDNANCCNQLSMPLPMLHHKHAPGVASGPHRRQSIPAERPWTDKACRQPDRLRQSGCALCAEQLMASNCTCAQHCPLKPAVSTQGAWCHMQHPGLMPPSQPHAALPPGSMIPLNTCAGTSLPSSCCCTGGGEFNQPPCHSAAPPAPATG